ncbi:MAG: HEAT repeat domain-containing protein [Myxococcaceae bacterium]|nr:HEAT repeat domain-containing protein [Myxococcaceae bacterium]
MTRSDLEPPPFAFDTAELHYAADRPVRPTHVRIEVTLDFPSRSIAGRCTTTVKAVRDVRSLSFDAVELDVSAVTVDGRPADFDNDGKRLLVQLNRTLTEGHDATVAVTYRCTPRRGLYFVGPDHGYPKRRPQVWTQGQDEDSRAWFPCLDAPAQKATTEVIATFPKKMTALSNGNKVGDVVKGALRTVHHRLDVPHSPYLVTLVVAELDEHVAFAGKTKVRTLFPRGQKADALRCCGRTPQMLKVYEDLAGCAYPWGDYAQVFVSEFIFGGMENTGATTLTDAVLHDERAHLDYSAEPLISHELAHQWFGDWLTCRDWPHGWLNEGFATYCEVLWKEEADGIDEADHQRRADLAEYLDEAAERYTRPIVERKFDAPIELFDRHLYEKGAVVLHALRRWLGDADFKKAVRTYVKRHGGGAVETVDLARAVEDATGKNPDRFFDELVYRAGHVQLKVKLEHDAEAGRLDVRVKQTQGGEPYHLPLDVHLVTGGKTFEHVLELEKTEQVFHLPCARPPAQALVDPRRDLPGTVDVDKPAAWWRTELKLAFVARARTEAAAALGKDGSADSIEALGRALRDEKAFWGTRAACAKALGQTRTPAAKALLLGALAVRHPKARRAVVAALGTFRDDAAVAKALAALCKKGDPSCFVEAEAARALGRSRAADALPVLGAMLKRRSFADTVAIGALEGLAELSEPKAWPLVVGATRFGQAPFARRAAVTALAKLAEPAGKKREAVDLIGHLLEDPLYRVRLAAIDAARELGDDRLVGPLSSTPFFDGRERRNAREAVRALRAKQGSAKELAELRRDVDALKTETKALAEKLAARAVGAVKRARR